MLARFTKSRSVVAIAVAASLAAVGCSGGGGGGGKSSSSSSTGGAGSPTGGGAGGGTSSGSTGTPTPVPGDNDGPAITVTAPARGAFVSGAAQQQITGNVSDISGVKLLEVNGAPATFGANGDFSVPVTLDFGTNFFMAKAEDFAGNKTYMAWECLYSPSYLAPNAMVPSAGGGRVSDDAIDAVLPLVSNALAAAGGLAQALVGQTFNVQGLFSFTITTLDIPQAPVVTVSPQAGFVRLGLEIPEISIDAVASGVGIAQNATLELDAQDVEVSLDLEITVDANNDFEVNIPSASVTFATLSATSNDPGLNAILGLLLQSPQTLGTIMATALRTAVPPPLETALNAVKGPFVYTVLGMTVSVAGQPSTIAVDPAGITFGGDTNVQSLTPLPRYASAPGSVWRGATSLPSYTTSHDIIVSLNEAAVNQAAFAAWQAGAFQATIDQAFINSLGFPLPFQLDASLILPFFPALQALATPGQPVPVAFQVEAVLPPVVEVTGAPSLVTTSFGEMQVSLAMDFGQGYQQVLTLSLGMELGTTVSIDNWEVELTLGQPARVTASILANPLGLNQVDIDSFLNIVVPLAIQFGGQMIPKVPLPPLPGGVPQPASVTIRQDAPPEFLTIEADL